MMRKIILFSYSVLAMSLLMIFEHCFRCEAVEYRYKVQDYHTTIEKATLYHDNSPDYNHTEPIDNDSVSSEFLTLIVEPAYERMLATVRAGSNALYACSPGERWIPTQKVIYFEIINKLPFTTSDGEISQNQNINNLFVVSTEPDTTIAQRYSKQVPPEHYPLHLRMNTLPTMDAKFAAQIDIRLDDGQTFLINTDTVTLIK